MAMNREQRRLLQRQGQLDAEGNPVTARRENRPPPQRVERSTPVQYVREIRGELRKVAWPTRSEVVNYTIVVLVTVLLLTGFVFVLDFVFGELIFNLLRASS
jgi:preprotein translocase subunit SecE